MTIRERVASAIYETWWHKIEGFDGDPYFGSSSDLWKKWLPAADRTIAAFLEAAAEKGWHMRPDETTMEMLTAATGTNNREALTIEYRILLAAAPEFKWDR